MQLPDVRVGPAYKDSLSELSEFLVEDVSRRVVTVAPREGAGTVRSYLRLEPLWDARTKADGDDAFAPLRRQPPQTKHRVDVERLEASIERLTSSDTNGMASELAAIKTAAVVSAQQGDLETYLRAQAAQTVKNLPDSSWWYLSVDSTMLTRAAFFRTQLGLTLAPDLLDDREERNILRAFSGLTMSNGVNFAELVAPALLAFSPAATGLLLPTLPHAVVLMTGTPMELRMPWPTTPQQLFEPRMLSDFGPRLQSRTRSNAMDARC